MNGDRERSLDWDQRLATERPGASYMRFSARAAGVGGGRRNVNPRPSCGGLQEIVMLTLIEETGPRIGRPSRSSHLGCLAGLFKAILACWGNPVLARGFDL